MYMRIKENKSRDKYLDFIIELEQWWYMELKVIPILIGVLGTTLCWFVMEME